MNQAYSMQQQMPVASIGVDARATFITRTYLHLFGAIIAFVLVEVFLFSSGIAQTLARAMLSTSWLLVLGGFMVVGWLGSRMASSGGSLAKQYAGLGVYVLGQAIIFVPLLFIAQAYAPGAIESAAMVTLLGFAGLTAIAVKTRKDFSFLGGMLRWGFVGALVLIVAGVIFGFQLGTFFSVAMIVLAGGAILYDTSNVLLRYPEDQYVAASLQLFASVALMFWYVLQLFMSRD